MHVSARQRPPAKCRLLRINPLAWTLRALVTNELNSPRWDVPSGVPGLSSEWTLFARLHSTAACGGVSRHSVVIATVFGSACLLPFRCPILRLRRRHPPLPPVPPRSGPAGGSKLRLQAGGAVDLGRSGPQLGLPRALLHRWSPGAALDGSARTTAHRCSRGAWSRGCCAGPASISFALKPL